MDLLCEPQKRRGRACLKCAVAHVGCSRSGGEQGPGPESAEGSSDAILRELGAIRRELGAVQAGLRHLPKALLEDLVVRDDESDMGSEEPGELKEEDVEMSETARGKQPAKG